MIQKEKTMSLHAEINAAAEVLKSELDAHPECQANISADAALTGTPRRHAAFYLGRFPDIEKGEGKPAPPPSQKSPEQRLLDWLNGATGSLRMLNPICSTRHLGKGTGTLPASFGIRLNPELGFTPEGSRPLAEVLREGIPDPETSGIFPEMREDIEVAEAGHMINPMTAGSISVDEALASIGDRPIMLGIGEELPAGDEERVMCRLFDLAARNPRLTFGFTGLGWKKADEPAMRDLHLRMNKYYARVVERGAV